jgi:hypothetical protein
MKFLLVDAFWDRGRGLLAQKLVNDDGGRYTGHCRSGHRAESPGLFALYALAHRRPQRAAGHLFDVWHFCPSVVGRLPAVTTS